MSAGVLRYRGPLSALSGEDRLRLLDRTTSSDEQVRRRTAELIARVRREGDAALFQMAAEFDGAKLSSLEVPRRHWREALDTLAPPLRKALERAADNIARAHRAFLPRPLEVETEPGVLVGRRPEPLSRVGVYAPGGRAAYPSSVLMGAVPARVAGVGEVVLCSPPSPAGLPTPVVLAAAELANVDRVFALGGAGAIAALAYGTRSVPRVDRIVGPGNAYVAEAKAQVSGQVAIDAPAGPSELLAIADASADPAAVAREMLAQAEHDPRACVVTLALDEAIAERIEAALEQELTAQPRRAIVTESLSTLGGLFVAGSLEEAIAFSNAFGPEHLLLALADPRAALERIRHAGTVFLGETSSVAFGDYMTGANHVLPTGGLARSYSGLSVTDFMRWTWYQRVERAAAARMAGDVGTLADSEGLAAHAAAARAWKNPEAMTSEAAGPRRTLELIRQAYREIDLYTPERPPSPIDLTDNTNLYGVPPHAERTYREVATAALTRYPNPYVVELKAALAAYSGVVPSCVVTGCGSDDVLDSAIRAFCEPGERLAYPAPSFAMMPLFAKMNGLEGLAVPLKADLDLDAEGLLATGAKVIYVCSPNNPTGTLASRRAMELLLERAPGVVILDEAYAEYCGQDYRKEAVRHGRLLVVRTMSKAFGLAGLRIGYAIGAPALVAEVEKSRGPYKIGGAAERTAVAALTRDLDWVKEKIADVLKNRARLTEALRAMGLSPVPSEANFVLVPVKTDALTLARAMRQRHGVAVRAFGGMPGLGEALRISLGPWEQLQVALDALKAVLT